MFRFQSWKWDMVFKVNCYYARYHQGSGPSCFIKKNSPFLLEAALEVLEELRNNFGEDHGQRKVLIWWKKNPQTNEPNEKKTQHFKKHLYNILALKAQESYPTSTCECKTHTQGCPSIKPCICPVHNLPHLFNTSPLLCDTFHHSVLYYLIIAWKKSNLCTKFHFSHILISVAVNVRVFKQT